ALIGTGTAGEATAVNPYDDGTQRFRIGSCGPDVQVETVLTHLSVASRLHAARREIAGIAHAIPRCCWLGRAPAAFSRGRLGVGDAAIDAYGIVDGNTLQSTLRGLDRQGQLGDGWAGEQQEAGEQSGQAHG